MKIWAHRGCSQRYPENTLTAFRKAAMLFDKGLCGIELDVQLTKDQVPVVIHDERIDRTTDGYGFVRDYTLEELKTFHIHTGKAEAEHIPEFADVLELLEDHLRRGFKLNVELKNNVFPYPGMEEIICDMIRAMDLEESVVYSSFLARSVEKIHALAPKAECAVLDRRVSDCLYKLLGGCGASVLHPAWNGMDLPAERVKDYTVRAWLEGHLYPEKPTGKLLDLEALSETGITDVFLNEPEVYLF